MGLAWGIVCFGSRQARENVYHPMSKTRAAFPRRRAVVSRSESDSPKGHALLILFLEEWPEPSGVSFGALKRAPPTSGLVAFWGKGVKVGGLECEKEAGYFELRTNDPKQRERILRCLPSMGFGQRQHNAHLTATL